MRGQRVLGVVGLILVGALAGAWAGLSTSRHAPPDPKIATIDLFGLVQRISELPEYADQREAEITRYTAEIEDLNTQLQVARQEANTKTGAEQTEIFNQVRTLQGMLTMKQSEAQQALEQMATSHFKNAHAKVQAAARQAAETLGYTHVISRRSPSVEINAEVTGLFLQELLLRDVVVAPSGDDLTAYVAEEILKLPAPADGSALTPEGAASDVGTGGAGGG